VTKDGVTVAKEIELEELSQAVEPAEITRGVEALLEIALVHQIVEPRRVFQKAPHVAGSSPTLRASPAMR
jgi:hypothetical protein